jgi:hypothetical protein
VLRYLTLNFPSILLTIVIVSSRKSEVPLAQKKKWKPTMRLQDHDPCPDAYQDWQGQSNSHRLERLEEAEWALAAALEHRLRALETE